MRTSGPFMARRTHKLFLYSFSFQPPWRVLFRRRRAPVLRQTTAITSTKIQFPVRRRDYATKTVSTKFGLAVLASIPSKTNPANYWPVCIRFALLVISATLTVSFSVFLSVFVLIS